MKNEFDNFNAGPSALPPQVRRSIQHAIDEVEGGVGILEMSHRSPQFSRIIEGAKERIRSLYQLPDTHDVLFLQGGASLQFAMIPFNLGSHGGFLTTGEWSKRAFAEAERLAVDGQKLPVELWSDEQGGFTKTPHRVKFTEQASELSYLHLTSNNTIYGTQYRELPRIDPADPESSDQVSSTSIGNRLVIDASSDLFSRRLDWSRILLLYAGAQKNAGPAGVTIVIGRREVLHASSVHPYCPKILSYRTHTEKGSLYHTPNTLGIYAVGEVARWVEQQGGLDAIEQRATQRANEVYRVIDHYPDVFEGHATKSARSIMNITFKARRPEIEQTFLARASELNMIGLKGHRSVGGLRASLYNAVSDESVQRLIQLIEEVAAMESS